MTTAKVYIKTFGCAFNKLDSQTMQGYLQQDDFSITQTPEEADMIVINSCSVKNLAEHKFFQEIKKWEDEGKKIIVAGCVPQAEQAYLSTKLKNYSAIGTNTLNNISFVAKETLKGNTVQDVDKTFKKRITPSQLKEHEKVRLNTHTLNQQSLIAIIPINEGCLNRCSFCKTKLARGNLLSYSVDALYEQCRNALEKGSKELYLTSQDTGCYGFDIGTNLCELLKKLLTLEGDFKIRIGMGNPNHFKHIIEELMPIMQDDRIYKFLHIPVQSASNRILDEMKRQYHVEEYHEILRIARKHIPNITLANDIIVAYPTETDEEFLQTVDLIKEGDTNVLNFSRFWLRPGTPAEKMYTSKQFIDGSVSKQRLAVLKEAFKEAALKNNKKWIGWKGKARIIEEGKLGTNTYVARNEYYKPIIIKKTDNIQLGDIIDVEIINSTWYHFEGETFKS